MPLAQPVDEGFYRGYPDLERAGGLFVRNVRAGALTAQKGLQYLKRCAFARRYLFLLQLVSGPP